jgi:hypothetical protein
VRSNRHQDLADRVEPQSLTEWSETPTFAIVQARSDALQAPFKVRRKEPKLLVRQILSCDLRDWTVLLEACASGVPVYSKDKGCGLAAWPAKVSKAVLAPSVLGC